MRRLLLLFCLALFASPANAAPKQAQFHGKIYDSSDEGIFGSAGSLDGLDAVLTFVFNNQIGSFESDTDNLTFVDSYGSVNSSGELPLYATLTVNGIKSFIYGASYNLHLYNDDTFDTVFYSLDSLTGPNAFAEIYSTHNLINSVQLIDEQRFTLSPGDYAAGGFNIFDYDTGKSAFGSLLITKVWMGPAVPEPATWIMMIVGFGVLGVGLRRRRQKISAVEAVI